MKIKLYIILFILSLFPITTYGWGEEGHELIAKKALLLLPEQMSSFKVLSEYIEKHAADPDKRKRDDKTEEPKHFIDIDFYPEFRQGHMIFDQDSLKAIYGDSVVSDMGILPWATLQTYKNLVQALRDKNRDRILIYSADLAHYVADGHQPMHTMINYNGQLSGQKGIHSRYETHMVNRYLNVLDNSFYTQTPFFVPNPLDFIFYYITNANLVSDVLYDADMKAFNETGSRESEEYYSILWFRTKYITTLLMNNAAEALASLYYSAWTEAGSPDLTDLG